MKAKEYAKIYLEETKDVKEGDYLSAVNIKAISKVLSGLLLEWRDLCITRGGSSYEALHTCWLEVETKWKAFCRLVPPYSTGGLRRYVLQTNPTLNDMFEHFDAIELKIESRRKKRH